MAKKIIRNIQKEKIMADTKKENAPNPATETTQNVGGKQDWNKTEGGTAKSDVDKVTSQLGPDKLSSPSEEEAKKAAEGIFTKTEEKDGVKTYVSSVSEDEANKAKDVIGKLPTFKNETQSLTGSVGQINLTQGGRLNSDKSVRADRSLDEINKELNERAGANPSPNRDGNELLRATNGISPAMVATIDEDTSFMANDLKEIIEKENLSEDAKRKLQDMQTRLNATGRV